MAYYGVPPGITKTMTTHQFSTHLTNRPLRYSASSTRVDPIKSRYIQPLRSSVKGTLSLSEGYSQLPALLSNQTDLRQELTALNDRLAQYIDKVKSLETQKKILQSRITELRSSKGRGDGSNKIYEGALEKMRSEIAGLAHENATLRVHLDNSLQDLKEARAKLQDEMQARQGAEKEAEDGRNYVDDATVKLCDKDRQLETLQEKYDILKATTDESIAALTSEHALEVYESELECAPAPSGGDLSESLREIRDAYDELSTNTDSPVIDAYKKKISDLQADLKKANQAAAAAKADLAASDKTLQTYMTEIEGLRSTNASLGMMNANLQECLEKERDEYNDKIQELEDKQHAANEEMAEYLGQYNKFLNMKKLFDIEIAAYRKLLEGEEDRLDTRGETDHPSNAAMSQSYTVHQTTHHYYSGGSDEFSGPKHAQDGASDPEIKDDDINMLGQVVQEPLQAVKAEDQEISKATITMGSGDSKQADSSSQSGSSTSSDSE